jgi:hypothetical protein
MPMDEEAAVEVITIAFESLRQTILDNPTITRAEFEMTFEDISPADAQAVAYYPHIIVRIERNG